MAPTIIPTWNIAQGYGFYQEYQVLEDYPDPDSPPDNFENYTAVYHVAETLDGPDLLSGSCTTASDGVVTVSIDQADTANLKTTKRMGGQTVGVAQIAITDPDGNVSHIWQAPVHISRSL